MLHIKPVMHASDEGKLENVSKARGRGNAIKALCEHMKETAVNPKEQVVFISHGGCYDDAVLLADMIRSEIGCKEIHINYVGPVIGAHSGPGTLALFFIAEHR